MHRQFLCAGAVLALTAATPVLAAPAVGLTGEATLVAFDTETRSVTAKMDVEGVGRLVGIDLRPADGTLIGVNDEHAIFIIDTQTGEATAHATMDTPLPLDGAPVIVDFNPKADKLRYMSGTTNHRVDVDTGAVTVDGSLAFEEGDMHAGEAPNIVAASYTNSFGTPETTALYDIDATIGALIRQTSPNDGTLAAIGKLGPEVGETVAFDVRTTAGGENTAYLVAGNVLHTVDLETGEATEIGAITADGELGVIRDVTFLPAD